MSANNKLPLVGGASLSSLSVRSADRGILGHNRPSSSPRRIRGHSSGALFTGVRGRVFPRTSWS
jgi:hypothetical protein